MVSIEGSRRYKPEIQADSKKARHSFGENYLINLVSPYRSENISKLKVLFPCITSEELAKVLDDCCNSFELALNTLQTQERAKLQEVLINKQTEEVIQELSLARSEEEAVGVIKKVIQMNEKIERKADKEEEVKIMQEHLKNITNENVILKKAIVKLNDSQRDNIEKDKEIEYLEKELEIERCRSYSLSIQLSQALQMSSIKSSNNIF